MAELPSNIIQARDAATTAATSAGNAAAGGYTIGDILKQKVTDAYNANQDVIKNLDSATMGYVGAPTAARAKYEGIFNPAQRESLVSQYTGNQALPMLSLSSILGQRFGRIEDLIGAGTRGYQGMVAGEQAKAANLQDLYKNLLSEYQLTQPQYSWVDLGGTKALVDEKGNVIKTMNVTKTPGAGDSGAYDLATALKLLGIGNESTGIWEDVTPAATQPSESTWQDPLRAIQKKQELENSIPWGSVNLSGVTGLGGNVY